MVPISDSVSLLKVLHEKNKIDVSQTVFIDDRAISLYPAEKLGIKSILFKNAHQLRLENTFFADTIV